MDRVGLWVGPYEVVARVWVPEPGIWYAGRGDSDAGRVLVRFGSPARPDELEELQHQHQLLCSLDDPRLPEAVLYDERESALVVRGGLGATLADAIALRAGAEVALTPGTLIDLLLEVGGALTAVHAAGEVHGHLEPGSVVLEQNGTVWLYGLGAAKLPSAAFLAPDLARGQAATPWTDQWAVGALGLALVLGHPPWRSEDPRAEAAEGDLARVVEAVARQWPALGHVLGRMVASEPAERFPALDQATDALAELASLAGPSEREAVAIALAGVPRPPVLPDDGAGGAPTAVPATDADDRESTPWGIDDGDDDDDTDDQVLGDLGAFSSPGAGWAPGADSDGADDDEEDPEIRPELTDPIGWFQTPAPAPDPMLPPSHELSLTAEPPAPVTPGRLWSSPSGPVPGIVRLAPLLAGAMVVLLVVWLVVRVL
jgi:serine/threonine protein kinase